MAAYDEQREASALCNFSIVSYGLLRLVQKGPRAVRHYEARRPVKRERV